MIVKLRPCASLSYQVLAYSGVSDIHIVLQARSIEFYNRRILNRSWRLRVTAPFSAAHAHARARIAAGRILFCVN